MIKLLILLFVVLWVNDAKAIRFSPCQLQLLHIAETIGGQVRWAETIQAILLQETFAGLYPKTTDGELGVGVMQVRPSTAKLVAEGVYVAKLDKTLASDLTTYDSLEGYRDRLIADDRYSILIGSLYFSYAFQVLKGQYGHNTKTWRRAIVAYNRGIAGAGDLTDAEINDNKYLQGVRKKFRLLHGLDYTNIRLCDE